jgi:bifunctional DNase/RNase
MFEVLIDSVRVSLMNYQRVVILKEKDSDRYLPIWIGPAEADAIAVKLQDVSVPRPLTHDLLGSVISMLGANIEKIVVSDLSNDTFYAKIILAANDGQRELDCRPSDALAVAVRANVPIFVEEVVMDKAGITMEKETGKSVSAGEHAEQLDNIQPRRQKVSGEELKRLSAFQEFIQNLKGLEELEGGSSSGSSS